MKIGHLKLPKNLDYETIFGAMRCVADCENYYFLSTDDLREDQLVRGENFTIVDINTIRISKGVLGVFGLGSHLEVKLEKGISYDEIRFDFNSRSNALFSNYSKALLSIINDREGYVENKKGCLLRGFLDSFGYRF
jgi:hypothetical protein